MENKIIEQRDGFSTRYIIEGSELFVEGEIGRIMRDYHPAGYGTFARRDPQGDGNLRAFVTRSNSCD